MEKISLGLINFINCLPINYTLDKWAHENIIISRGHPVLINQLMNSRQVYAGPISAFEYVQNKDKYVLIKEACITSDAECGSVILFSNCELKDIEGKIIGLPYNSATSINMLKILLNQKGLSLKNIKFVFHKNEKPLDTALKDDFDAILYIGDKALISGYKFPDKNTVHSGNFYKYDLGELWKEITSLPPVFGTWAARADWAITHKDDFEWIKFIINKAVEAGLGMYFNEVVKKAASDTDLPEDFIKDYLTAKIKYNFTEEQEKSLNLFKELYDKLDNSHKADN